MFLAWDPPKQPFRNIVLKNYKPIIVYIYYTEAGVLIYVSPGMPIPKVDIITP